MHCSDYRGDDYQLDVLPKHTPSDDPCLAVVAFGPTLPDVSGALVDAIG